MKDIMELVSIVTPNKLKNIQTLGASNSQADKLYWLVQKGVVENDEDALAQLYPGKKSKTSLYHTKEKLYNKLLDSTIIIDSNVENISSFSLAHHDCLKHCTAFEKISLKGGRKSLIKLGDKILKIALKYNMHLVIMRVSRILMRKAVYVLRSEKKMTYYRDLYLKYSKIGELHELANFYSVKISLRTNPRNLLVDSKLIDETQTYISDLESKLVPDHTALTLVVIYSLKVRIEEFNQNYVKVIQLIDEFLEKIKVYKDVHSNYFTINLYRKLTALIFLRKFTDAQKVAIKTLKYTTEGNSAWYTALENLIILHLHQTECSDAWKVYKRAIYHKGLRFLPPDRQEIFKVYRAYLQFFINLGILPIEGDDKDYKVYRSSKFANEVPIFSKDKTGINISIIVAQFLLLFTEEKYHEAIDKIDYIKQYSKANLRKGQTFRAHCFLKMIVKMIECNYHKAATIRKTKTLYGKLKNQPSDLLRQTSYVEIVPYEVLWDILLGSIDNNFRGKVKTKQK